MLNSFGIDAELERGYYTSLIRNLSQMPGPDTDVNPRGPERGWRSHS